MTVNMMKMLIEKLAQEQFYELIFVLLTVHRNAEFMDNIFKNMLLEMILSGWKGELKSNEQIIHKLTDLLT